MSIQRASPVPLYQQLYTILRSQIEFGQLQAGDVLPTEETLTTTYHISRVTARKALQQLADEGLLVRKPGKGTFVNSPKLEEPVRNLRGFDELMIEQMPDQVMDVPAFQITPAAPSTAQQLGLNKGEAVLAVKRRHLIHRRPVALAHIYLPYRLGKLLTPHDVATRPIYDLLATKAGITVKRAVQRISATAASADTAALLGVSASTPLLCVMRVTYDIEEHPVEYVQLYYPGGQHEIVVELYR
jgi:GntR family transcriptional regulator